MKFRNEKGFKPTVGCIWPTSLVTASRDPLGLGPRPQSAKWPCPWHATCTQCRGLRMAGTGGGAVTGDGGGNMVESSQRLEHEGGTSGARDMGRRVTMHLSSGMTVRQ
jgi:hypothetical protein